MKWSEARPVLFKDIREGPVRHRLGEARRLAHLLQNEGRGDVLVVNWIGRRVSRAPLRVVQLELGRGGAVDQAARVTDAFDDCVWRDVEDSACASIGIDRTLGDAVGVG